MTSRPIVTLMHMIIMYKCILMFLCKYECMSLGPHVYRDICVMLEIINICLMVEENSILYTSVNS